MDELNNERAQYTQHLERTRVMLNARLEQRLEKMRSLSDSEFASEVDQTLRQDVEHSLLRAIRRNQHKLREIARALNKIRVGEYGICEGSGNPIEPQRLEVKPWTRFSVAFLEQRIDSQTESV